MTLEWKKVSMPLNYSGGGNERMNEIIKRHRRLAIHDMCFPARLYFYLKGEFDDGYYKARDKWKQGLIGFASVKEYRMFHEKMV